MKNLQGKNSLTEENELAIALSVTEEPTLSFRELSKHLDIKKSSVGKALKKHKFHPYYLHLHQELTENDFGRRVTFCQWARNKIEENPSFFKNVLFPDESTFHRNGFVNRHNFHYYATENPHAVLISNFQHKWSLNVWGAIFHDYVIEPFFFEQHLTGERFLRSHRDDLPTLLQHIPLVIQHDMYFQLDGALAHYHREVRDHLEQYFSQKWIGREGPIQWPARFPDLTIMDFFYGVT